jgi:SPFH domain / Band 7 family
MEAGMATRDRNLTTIPGLVAAAIWLLLAVAVALLALTSLTGGDAVSWTGVTAATVLALLLVLALNGFVVVQPNQAKVAVFLGRYVGTIRRSGFHWVNPLTTRRTLSLRIRNLDTDVLKVNDANGNPIEISAVITWQVNDAAQAAFDVEDYDGFVTIQAETAVRHVASVFPYDSYEEGQESLRGAADRVSPPSRPTSRSGWTWPGWGCSTPGCAGSPTPPRSPPTCSAASRPTPSSPPASGSSRGRWAWSTTP